MSLLEGLEETMMRDCIHGDGLKHNTGICRS